MQNMSILRNSQRDSTGALDLTKRSPSELEPTQEEIDEMHLINSRLGVFIPTSDQRYVRVCYQEQPMLLDLRHTRIPKTESPTCDSSSYTTNSSQSSNEFSDNITRSSKSFLKDGSYFERRRKNNLAAKKSRDAKRKRESEIKARLIILEEENKRLKQEMATCCCRVRKYLFSNMLMQ